MRIKLKEVIKFFDEILWEENINLKEFSKKINANYSPMKKYRRGELSLPEKLFEKIIKFSPNKEFWLRDLVKEKDNWGSVKGGKTSGPSNDMDYVRGFRKIVKPKIKLNKRFCEFYGALLGDGCLSRFKDQKGTERIGIYFTGNKKLDSEYMKYLKKIITDEFGIYVYYYEEKKKNVTRLNIFNKSLALELNNKLEVPIGLKYDKIKISEKIQRLPWNTKKFVIRGLFDTDGCILANKIEGYKYPWVIITSKSRSFLEQIRDILREKGYPAYITGTDVCVRGIKNLEKWFKDIGSSNSRNLAKYEYFLKNKCLPARVLDGPVC